MPRPQNDDSPFLDNDARAELRERKRDAILVAAVQMFNERGYHATSLDDVAAQLGVSKPLVYHYLGNKEQVLLRCMARGLQELQEAFHAARSTGGTGLDRLRRYLVGYAEVIMADFGRCVIRTGDEVLSAESRPVFRADKRKIDSQLRVLVTEAMEDGSVEVGDVRFATFAIAGALNWPARWHRDDGARSTREVAEELARFLVEGLRPRG
ncbi:TetR/AcrR family transcriptional regulator [Sphingobium sufflavum]|uniref:TetR/AcrR family transcriptional regulator n=1 Tax=Sphingobium sufflavum TaxID=1129547 RepID=UPI001F4622FB|nr:TetR/AcrR family transcriptional regulator [Sphingobium sufflavum]MCE7795449.1 TetR/AcrR family transcriptional regulator [Sphingobium sufflavum]